MDKNSRVAKHSRIQKDFLNEMDSEWLTVTSGVIQKLLLDSINFDVSISYLKKIIMN